MQEDAFDAEGAGAQAPDPHMRAVHTLVRLEPHIIHTLTLLQHACQPASASAVSSAPPPQTADSVVAAARLMTLSSLFSERPADVEAKCNVSTFVYYYNTVYTTLCI